MRVNRELYAVTCWAAVAAFVPNPSVRQSRFSCVSANPSYSVCRPRSEHLFPLALQQAADTEDVVASTTVGSGVAKDKPRATMPAVLVGSGTKILRNFAEHLAAGDPSFSVIDLGEVAKNDGSQGVEAALDGSKTSTGAAVLVCPSTVCLDHPEVRSLVHAHPLTVHLAIEGEDPAVRERCERATKYTVLVSSTAEKTTAPAIVEEAYATSKDDLSRLLSFARQPKPSPEDVELNMGKNTFFLSLTFKDFAPHKALLTELTEGVDAMELRVDLLANHDPYSVLRQLSILRAHTGYLPVVFTIRSKGQCGAFPDNPESLFSLARWGLRAGCEVMDVEANWPISYREGLIKEARENYPGAVLVGSYHVVGRKTTEEQAQKLFMECYHDGAVDAVKVLFFCNCSRATIRAILLYYTIVHCLLSSALFNPSPVPQSAHISGSPTATNSYQVCMSSTYACRTPFVGWC